MFICAVKFDIRDDPTLQNCSQESQHLPSMTVFLMHFNHARELNIAIQLIKAISWLFVMSNLIPNMMKSSKTTVRNHQHPLCVTVLLMHL